jgi:hypothetical protein
MGVEGTPRYGRCAARFQNLTHLQQELGFKESSGAGQVLTCQANKKGYALRHDETAHTDHPT